MTESFVEGNPFGSPIRCFSFGGGVQSTAALVLASQEHIDYKIFMFSNVGDDSEHPDTLRYVHEIAMPYAKGRGIELMELRKRPRGTEQTLYQKLTRQGSRSIGIPVRLEGSGAPGQRSCTADFKVRRIAAYQKLMGATVEQKAVVGLGISLDEWKRMRTSSGIRWQTLEYPLIDLRLTRQDCMNIIEREGLPIPPKSSCFFCPYRSIRYWRDLRETRPDLFQISVELEQTLSDRGVALGRGKMYLTDRMVPLSQAVGPAGTRQLNMFDDGDTDACESGFCMV